MKATMISLHDCNARDLDDPLPAWDLDDLHDHGIHEHTPVAG